MLIKNNVLVIGAGPTGLATGWKLAESGYPVSILEKESHIGGISASFHQDGFVLDYGPHKIYTELPHVLKIVKDLLGDDLLAIPKKSRVRLKGKYYSYPIGIKDILFKLNPLVSMRCMALFGMSLLSRRPEHSYEDYLINRFGRGIYELVFAPYAEKVWGDPELLSAELARTRVPASSLLQMLFAMIRGNKKTSISADQFYYPESGIGSLWEAFHNRIVAAGGSLYTGTRPAGLHVAGKRVDYVTLKSNSLVRIPKVDYVVSTMPISELPSLISPRPGKEVLQAADSLRYRNIILVYLFVNKPRLFTDNWIFFPEKEFIFNRISEQKGFSAHGLPADRTVLTAEITCSSHEAIWKASDSLIAKQVAGDLERAGIVRKKDIQKVLVKRLSNIYPLYDMNYAENLNTLLDYLDGIDNLVSNGRSGLFNYNNMDHCIDMGLVAAEHVMSGGTGTDWRRARKRFSEYRIVD